MSVNIPGYAVVGTSIISVQKNSFDFSFPNLNASSVVLKSGQNMQIAPSSKSGRFFVVTEEPVIGVSAGCFQSGDFVIQTGEDGAERTLYQRFNNEWLNIGSYHGQSATVSSPINGGTSNSLDAAIVACGDGGQIVLTGTWNLSRPISLDQAGLKGQIEIVFSGCTIHWNGNTLPLNTNATVTPTSYPAASIGTTEPYPIWVYGNGTIRKPLSGRQAFVRDLLIDGSFKL